MLINLSQDMIGAYTWTQRYQTGAVEAHATGHLASYAVASQCVRHSEVDPFRSFRGLEMQPV
jgi:hypothetical protein